MVINEEFNFIEQDSGRNGNYKCAIWTQLQRKTANLDTEVNAISEILGKILLKASKTIRCFFGFT